MRDVGAYSRDVFNLEQVEVAKGPADIGRGGASGYVNVATKIPRLETFTAGTPSFGFDERTAGDRQRATLTSTSRSPTPRWRAPPSASMRWQDSAAVGRNSANSQSLVFRSFPRHRPWHPHPRLHSLPAYRAGQFARLRPAFRPDAWLHLDRAGAAGGIGALSTASRPIRTW